MLIWLMRTNYNNNTKTHTEIKEVSHYDDQQDTT